MTLKTPLTIKHAGMTDIFPAGEYGVLYEDASGYYYEAPGKIASTTYSKYFLTGSLQGGIYIKRGDTNPTSFYIMGNYNRTHMYHVPKTNVFELKP